MRSIVKKKEKVPVVHVDRDSQLVLAWRDMAWHGVAWRIPCHGCQPALRDIELTVSEMRTRVCANHEVVGLIGPVLQLMLGVLELD